MRQVPAVLRLWLLAPLILGLAGHASAGDPELAAFLLKHGRIAISKGDHADALTKLQKARLEDPSLIEATYWIAVAHEKSRDKRQAVHEYRAFCRSAEPQERGGALGKDLAKLLRKAKSRLRSLDAANLEIDKAQAAFADDLCEMARTLPEGDDSLMVRVLTVIERAWPEHREAMDLLAEFRRASVPSPGVFGRVTEWHDLIKNGLFGKNDDWTYGKRRIDVSSGQGSVCLPPSAFDSGPSYVYTASMTLGPRVDENRTMVTGLMFALVNGHGFCALLLHNQGRKDRVALAEAAIDPPRNRPIKVVDMDPWLPEQTRRLSVVVEGNTIQVFLGTKPVIEHEVSDLQTLRGGIAVTHQNIRMQFGQIRIGALAGGNQ